MACIRGVTSTSSCLETPITILASWSTVSIRQPPNPVPQKPYWVISVRGLTLLVNLLSLFLVMSRVEIKVKNSSPYSPTIKLLEDHLYFLILWQLLWNNKSLKSKIYLVFHFLSFFSSHLFGDRIKLLLLQPRRYCGRDVLIRNLQKFTI